MSRIREQILPVALILTVGLTLSVGTYFAMKYVEERKIRADVKSSVWDHISAIEKEMITNLQLVQSLVSFKSASLEVERDEFRKFVNRPLKENSSIYSIQWVRRVTIWARTAYEESVKNEAGFPVQIKEIRTTGAYGPAGRRGEYFPVHFVEPFEPNEGILGLDHGSIPALTELMRYVRDEAHTMISGPVPLSILSENKIKSTGFLVYAPIYENDVKMETVGDRRHYLTGYIAGVFRYQDIVEKALENVSDSGLDFYLFDSEVRGWAPFYAHLSGENTSEEVDKITDDYYLGKIPYEYNATFTIGGREWRLSGFPTSAFLAKRMSHLPHVIAGFLIFSTIILIAYFVSLMRSSNKLTELNTDLANEVQKRIESEELLEKRAEEQKRVNEELDRLNAQLKELATVDMLTGFLNRRGLQQLLFERVSHWQRQGGDNFALMLDLDNFKSINDTFGFVVGDLVIKEISKKLREVLRTNDHISRIGGDEFIVILSEVREAEAMVVAQKIRFQIGQMTIGISTGKKIQVTTSIGVIPLLGEETSIDQLVEKAHFALREGKRLGKNRVVLSKGKGKVVKGADEMLSRVLEDLRGGLHFYTLLQPITRLEDNVPIGYELLSRLEHQEYGSPNDFFQIALEAKILTLVDRACLRNCLKTSQSLDDGLKIHVNLFPSTLIETPTEQLIEEFESCNGSHSVCLEVSEQQIVGNPDHIAKPARALRKAGISLSMDDVGFGGSCLESLILLEPEIVKIDRKCVMGISKDASKVRSLERLLRVIKSCNAEPYVEGIENEDDLRIVRDLGVQYGQGYFLGKPELEPVG